MKNEQNAPKIRFKGFTDAWELRKLSLSFDILQNNTLSRSELSIENGAARNVHYGDILVKYGEVLDLKTEELPFIQSSQTVDKLKGSFLQNGDIIMADTAEDETAGKCTEIANLDNMNVLAGLHTIPLRPKQKYAVGYLGYYMNSGSFHDKLLPLMQGTKVTSISKSALQGMSILRPADLEEQRQIGTYFRTLDRLITLHQRKCETLQKLKKSMLQKMFPKNGSYFPEIRFAGFTDAWEQRKFSDFTFPAGERNKDDLDLEPFAITSNQGFIAQSEAHDDFGYMKDVDRKMYIVVKPNSFAYNPARINVGSLGYYEGAENVIVSSLYEVFQTAEYVDDKFLKHWFKTKAFQDWIERLQEGSVRLYFYYDKLCECIMSMPSVEEQRKIGAYLDKIDNLITLHQRKLETLKKLKKAMLQKMFPPAGRAGI